MDKTYLKQESLFVDHAFDAVFDYFSRRYSQGFFTNEVGVGRTIADIVGFLTNCNRIPPVSVAFSILECSVFSCLRNNGATRIDLLERYCGMHNGELSRGRGLDRLRSWGVINESTGGRVALSSRWIKNYSLIAIEAKLTKWRDALRQATLYKKYANYSYVMLPIEFADNAMANLEEFQKNQVGLLVVDNSDICCVSKASKITSGHGWRREFVFSRLAKDFYGE